MNEISKAQCNERHLFEVPDSSFDVASQSISAAQAVEFMKRYFPGDETIEDSRSEERYKNETHVILSFGRKRLLYSTRVFNEIIEIQAMIANDSDAEKISGETTKIYSKLKDDIQQLANEYNIPATYTLITDDPTLQAWAKNAGKDLFEWNKITEEFFEKEQETELIAQVTIQPAA